MSGARAHDGAGAEPDVARTVLPGGLRVITESLPAVRSVVVRHLGRRRLA